MGDIRYCVFCGNRYCRELGGPGGTKYCSDECRTALRQKKWKEQNAKKNSAQRPPRFVFRPTKVVKKDKPLFKKECFFCKKEFVSTRDESRFCSVACSNRNRAGKVYKDPEKNKGKLSLDEKMKLAKEEGLTYGMWVAKQNAEIYKLKL